MDFDAALFDVFSELSAVPKLRTLGFDSFDVVLRSPNEKTPDLKARRHGERAAVEIKNLRAHECIETLFPKLFLDHQLRGQEHVSGIRLEVKRSFRETLNRQECEALTNILFRLKEHPRNEDVTENLSEHAVAHLVIIPTIVQGPLPHGCFPASPPSDSSGVTSLFAKIQSDLHGLAVARSAGDHANCQPVTCDARGVLQSFSWRNLRHMRNASLGQSCSRRPVRESRVLEWMIQSWPTG